MLRSTRSSSSSSSTTARLGLVCQPSVVLKEDRVKMGVGATCALRRPAGEDMVNVGIVSIIDVARIIMTCRLYWRARSKLTDTYLRPREVLIRREAALRQALFASCRGIY